MGGFVTWRTLYMVCYDWLRKFLVVGGSRTHLLRNAIKNRGLYGKRANMEKEVFALFRVLDGNVYTYSERVL